MAVAAAIPAGPPAYHELALPAPDVAVALNSGINEYEEWHPTSAQLDEFEKGSDHWAPPAAVGPGEARAGTAAEPGAAAPL